MSVPWAEIAAHRERLVRVAMRRVPTREDAEDVVSEAMLRCATFSELDPERLGQFLTAVTIRLCADLHRDSERSLRLVRRLDLDEEPSPEDLACAAADAETLRDVLRSLPDRHREVLIERAQGLSVTQISRRHSLTYKAAESALSRARSQVRMALAAAMSLVGAAVVALRRRPAVVAGVPIAAVAFVTTGHYVPHQPAPSAPREVVVAPRDPDSHRVGDVGGAGVPAAAPRVAARVPARRVESRALPPRSERKQRHERSVVRVKPAPGVDTEVTTNDEPLPATVKRCAAASSYTVEISINPNGSPELYGADANCNP